MNLVVWNYMELELEAIEQADPLSFWTMISMEVKQLHQKLLPKLSAFRGFWEVLFWRI